MIILIDGSKIDATNIDEVNDHTPIVIENLSVTIIAEGSCYLLENRELVSDN